MKKGDKMLPKEKNLEESIENYLVSIGYEQLTRV